MSLEALPDELLVRTTGYLEKKDLAEIRLVNARLSRVATEQLFRSIILYPHWRNESEGDDEIHSVDSETDGILTWTAAQTSALEGMASPANELDHQGTPSPTAEEDFVDNADKLDGEENELQNTAADTEANSEERHIRKLRRCRDDCPQTLGYVLTAQYLELRRGNEGSIPEFIPRDEDIRLTDFDRNFDSFYSWIDRGRPEDEQFSSHFASLLSSYVRQEEQHEREKEEQRQRQRTGDRGPGYNAQVFLDVLVHETLKHCVEEAQVYTCEPHCDHHPMWTDLWHRGTYPVPNYDPRYHECIRRLKEFPNLRSVIVHFDRHAGEDHARDIFQKPDFQKVWLRRILGPLEGRLSSVAFRNYENTGDKGPEPRPETSILHSTLTGLKSLRMSVKHRETTSFAESQYHSANIHPFWNRFVDRFLRPSQQTLTKLVLYSDLYFGWFPTVDFRKIKLEKLRSLTLGHYVFFDWYQFDWILDHAATLEELNLDRCSILYQVGHAIAHWLDEDSFPIGHDPYGAGFPDYGQSQTPVPGVIMSNVRFAQRLVYWHQAFDAFREKLYRLHTFRFGMSKRWDFRVESRFTGQEEDGDFNLPIMPWRDEENIQNCIKDIRYLIWDDWRKSYYTRWELNDGHEWLKQISGYIKPFPDLQREDSDAFKDLLEQLPYNNV